MLDKEALKSRIQKSFLHVSALLMALFAIARLMHCLNPISYPTTHRADFELGMLSLYPLLIPLYSIKDAPEPIWWFFSMWGVAGLAGAAFSVDKTLSYVLIVLSIGSGIQFMRIVIRFLLSRTNR